MKENPDNFFTKTGPARGPASLARWLCALLVISSFGVLAACRSGTPKPVDFSDTPRTFLVEDYEGVWERWTRHDHVYAAEGLVLEIWATLKSVEFREAFVEKYADAYDLPEPEKQSLRVAEIDNARSTYEFHVVTQMNDDRWNDFDDPSSAWRLILEDGAGARLNPQSIETSKLPGIYAKEFFPKQSPFTKSFVVRFARPTSGEFRGEDTGTLKLRISGPAANLDLVWVAR